MEDNHEKLKKEEIDQTKLSPTATELIAKYGNASTTIGGTFVLAGDFDYRDKAKKELEDYITELETQNQELMIRNNDKDAEIERLNATIDRTVNAWESLCIEKYDEIKRLNIVIDELIKKGFAYNRQQWSELVHRIQKERER